MTTTTDAANAWSTHAASYDKLFGPLTGYIAHNMFLLAASELPPTATILDVACGAGALTLPAAEWLRAQRSEPHGVVIATDFSSAMVDATNAAASARGLADFVRGEVHDGQALQLDDASCDAVFSCFGIFLFPDRVAGWREAARVLRSGGIFATSVWRGAEHNMMLRVQMGAMMSALPERLKQRPARSWLDIADAKGLEAEITAASADLTDIRIIALAASFVMLSPQVAWDAMLENPATGPLLRACDAAERRAVEDAVLTALTALAGAVDRPFVYDTGCNVLLARKR